MKKLNEYNFEDMVAELRECGVDHQVKNVTYCGFKNVADSSSYVHSIYNEVNTIKSKKKLPIVNFGVTLMRYDNDIELIVMFKDSLSNDRKSFRSNGRWMNSVLKKYAKPSGCEDGIEIDDENDGRYVIRVTGDALEYIPSIIRSIYVNIVNQVTLGLYSENREPTQNVKKVTVDDIEYPELDSI